MSMTAAQSSAFQAVGGFPPTASFTLFVGFCVALLYLWAAWAMYSTYRGWATNNLERSIAAGSAVRIILLCMILTFFVLS